jgi:hypothetical protein
MTGAWAREGGGERRMEREGEKGGEEREGWVGRGERATKPTRKGDCARREGWKGGVERGRCPSFLSTGKGASP